MPDKKSSLNYRLLMAGRDRLRRKTMNDITHPLAESVANKMSLAGCLRPTEGGDFTLGDPGPSCAGVRRAS